VAGALEEAGFSYISIKKERVIYFQEEATNLAMNGKGLEELRQGGM
jgi:hypothetical protein